jgi:predicted transposase YdaD
VVRKILTRLSQLKSDKTALNKYVRQLLILARLRNKLPNIIQNELGNMGTIGYDIEQDELYLKGKRAGRQDTQIVIALSCLAAGLSIAQTAKLTGLSEEKVQEIKDGLDKEEE